MATNLHDADFHAWTQEQAALIRSGRWSEVDAVHLAEEIEDMGKSERRTLESRLEVLLAHLLKWQFQPGRRGNSWRLTIKDQRRRLEKHLLENPSLRPAVPEFVKDVYPSAVVAAINETGLDDSTFPPVCPYTVEQVMNPEFLPD